MKPFDPGKCKTCGAEIYWARLTSGNVTPVETKRLTVITREGETVSGYESHFAHCPQAGLFRSTPPKDKDP